MPTEILGVVDSAVKIGLGALISGLATYVITHKNHSNEGKNIYREKKISILEYAVENIDPYFHAFQNCLDIADGALRKNISPGPIDDDLFESWEFIKDDEKLISTRERKNIALSRIRLIGLDSLHEKLLEILVVEKMFRDQLYKSDTSES